MPECGTLYGGILECGTFYERGTYMHDLRRLKLKYQLTVHGLIRVDRDRAYIMHARAVDAQKCFLSDYYSTFYATSVPLNCAHHEWVTVHLLPIHLDTVVPRGMYCDRGEV